MKVTEEFSLRNVQIDVNIGEEAASDRINVLARKAFVLAVMESNGAMADFVVLVVLFLAVTIVRNDKATQALCMHQDNLIVVNFIRKRRQNANLLELRQNIAVHSVLRGMSFFLHEKGLDNEHNFESHLQHVMNEIEGGASIWTTCIISADCCNRSFECRISNVVHDSSHLAEEVTTIDQAHTAEFVWRKLRRQVLDSDDRLINFVLLNFQHFCRQK